MEKDCRHVHYNTWSKEQTWFRWMDLIVVVIQVGELGVSWICSWIVTIIVHAPKICESICGCKLHYLCHVINMSFIISLMFIMTVVFCRQNGRHLWSHRWRRCGQLGAFSSGFSGVPGEILGSLVRNKIELDPTQTWSSLPNHCCICLSKELKIPFVASGGSSASEVTCDKWKSLKTYMATWTTALQFISIYYLYIYIFTDFFHIRHHKTVVLHCSYWKGNFFL